MAAIDALFDETVARGASDLHLGVNQPPLARVRGDLVMLRDRPLGAKELDEMLLELLTPAQRGRLATDSEVTTAIDHGGRARFRASYFAKSSGLAASFRLLPSQVPSLAELRCPDVFWRFADRRDGLVVLGGPAASGRTRTAAALLDHVNKTRACHIVSVEEPVEIVHEPLRAQITQREVGADVPSRVAALRAAARENADVVFASDLTTGDELGEALRLAGQGILVFVTVLASGVVSLLDQIVGAVPSSERRRVRGLLGECLAGVIVQHLVRATDGKSRFAVHEVLVGSDAVGALVRDEKTSELVEAMRSGEALGMQSLDGALEKLLAIGKIGPEAALDRAIDKESFARVVARVRPDLVDLS